jgi:putative endonuclease
MRLYYLYILFCADNSLYTGITNNLAKRMKAHREGKGSKYVRSRLPVKLIHTEELADKSAALQREAEVKSWTRAEKIEKLRLPINTKK